MSQPEAQGQCPNCLSDLEAKADGLRVCPICQYALRRCSACGGDMAWLVQVPDGVGIEEAGLPLELCEHRWVCQSPECGHQEEVER